MDRQLIASEIEKAMRERDKIRLSILRLVKNELDAKEKESGEEATPEQVVAAAKKVLKQTNETLDYSRDSGSDDERTTVLAAQVEILEGYLPQQVTGEALQVLVERIVEEHGFSEKRDMGKAIGLVAAETGGNVDKSEVAGILGRMLS
jgi:uncharacterized protein YqeY